MMEITQEDNFSVADAEWADTINASADVTTVDGYYEWNKEAVARQVKLIRIATAKAAEQAVLAKLRDLSDETVTAIYRKQPHAAMVRSVAKLLADALEQKP